jgi:hypothetical protein
MNTSPRWPHLGEPSPVQKLAHWFGRRGLKLISFGLAFMIYGSDIAFGHRHVRFSRPGPSPLDFMDDPLWGLLFLLGGLVAVVCGFQRKRNPDFWGFAGLQLGALTWALMYGVSGLVHWATDGHYGAPDRFSGFAIWLVLAFSIRVDAGWDEPVPDPPASISPGHS